MNLILYLFVFLVWFIALILILPKPIRKRTYKKQTWDIAQILGYEKVKREAESFGWNLNSKEFTQIVMASVGVGILTALLTGNIFFIVVGVALSFSLPRYIVIKIKKKKRLEILVELPDNLKLLTSKLMDYTSIQQALQAALEDMEGETKTIFQKMHSSLELNLPVDSILMEVAHEVKIRRFNDFAEKLVMANSEGFHEEAIKSLKETIDTISEDINEIKKLEIRSKSEKKKMYIVIVASWFMPFILSFLSSDNANVFLKSIHGQLFIISFFLSTIYVIAKGDDYLSLNLDEL
jgi:Flp pilus assembly protein TadB